MQSRRKSRSACIIAVLLVFAVVVAIYFIFFHSTVWQLNGDTSFEAAVTYSNQNAIASDNAAGTEYESGKVTEQYEGQAGDPANANCIDDECSNFRIPDEE